MKHHVLISIFLGLAVLAVLVGCAGMMRMRGAAARLHYTSLTALAAPLFVLGAVVSAEGLSQAGVKAILIVLVLWIQSPVVAHALGRAIHSQESLPLKPKSR